MDGPAALKEIKYVIKGDRGPLYSSQFDNLDEMDKNNHTVTKADTGRNGRSGRVNSRE